MHVIVDIDGLPQASVVYFQHGSYALTPKVFSAVYLVATLPVHLIFCHIISIFGPSGLNSTFDLDFCLRPQ